jgi:hypothetical protein
MCPEFPVSPVSNGQRVEKLKAIAARNACTERNTERKRFWKLMRDFKAVEKGIGRELEIGELKPGFDEWYRLSPFIDPKKPRDDYLAEFIAGLRKVRVATGEGDTFNKALKAVSKLCANELPMIPGVPDAPESWRRIAALHRELSRLCANGTYFLSYRDAAKACQGLTQQTAHNITGVLDRAGVIKIVRKGKAGKPGLNGGKAAEFRYLLPQNANGADDDDGGLEL